MTLTAQPSTLQLGRAWVVRTLPADVALVGLSVSLVADGDDGPRPLAQGRPQPDGIFAIGAYLPVPDGTHAVRLVVLGPDGAPVSDWVVPEGVLGMELLVDLVPTSAHPGAERAR